MTRYEQWAALPADGVQGTACIETFTVAYANAVNTEGMAATKAHVPAGTYRRLRVDDAIVMSDTPEEYRFHSDLFTYAQGHVLINGLGLGCCLNVVLNTPGVSRVTVVEENADVIQLVGPYFPDAEIMHGDAMTWRHRDPAQRYNTVWHDIWADLCLDDLAQMEALHERYEKIADWQGSWGRKQLERARRAEGWS